MDCPAWKISLCAWMLLALLPAAVAAAPGDDQYAVAAGHYARGQWQMAADEFRTLLREYREHPRAGVAPFYLGEALVQLGQFDEAHAAFADFTRQNAASPHYKQALFRLGETSYLAGRGDAAKDELARFAQLHPDDPLNAYVAVYLGDLATDSQDWEAARQHYQRSLDRFAQGSLADECRFGLARALENLNESAAAQRLYAEIAAKQSGDLAAEARYRLASAQYGRGDFAAAAAALGELVATFPQHRLADHARLAEGWARYRLKQFDRAEQLFAELAQRQAPSVEARYWLGLAQKAQGNWAGAAETLSSAATDSPTHELAAPLCFHAAESLLKAGKIKEADAAFAQLIAAYPASEWVDESWLGRARGALSAGNHSLVDLYAAHFAEHCPTSDKRPQLDRVKADSLIARKQYGPAIELLEELTLSETDCDAQAAHFLALAAAYLGAAEPAAALALIDNLPVETLAKARDEAQLTRAQALAALERFAEAAPLLEARLTRETDPARLAVCRAQLAICWARTGKLRDARQVYQQLAESGADTELVGATTVYLAEAARDAGDEPWSDELLAAATADGAPSLYAAKALASRGWDEFAQGRFEAAAGTLGQLIDKYPRCSDASRAALTRAQALQRLDRPAQALEAYRWILERDAANEFVPQAILAAARLHDQVGQDQEAAELFERLEAEYPQHPQRDAVLYEWAWVLADLGKPSDSQRRFEQLRQEFPSSSLAADAAFRLAERARQQQDFDRAEELLEQAITSTTEAELIQHVLYAQGQLAAAREQWAGVAEPLLRLKREFPDSSLGLLADYWLAEAAYRLGNYDDAETRFARLCGATAGRQEDWVALCSLRRAQLAAHRADWPQARQLAERIAADFPRFARQHEADYVIGRALAGQSLYAEAREAYRRVLASKTGGKTETAAMAQWMIGESYLNQKDYATALNEFLRIEILYAFPTWQAAALLQAGKCQEMLGQSREARALYARLVKEYPETEFAAEARTRLKAVSDVQARRTNRSGSGKRARL